MTNGKVSEQLLQTNLKPFLRGNIVIIILEILFLFAKIITKGQGAGC